MKKLWKSATFIKYFVSYLVILSIALVGVLLVVDLHVKSIIQASYTDKDMASLAGMTENIKTQFSDLNRTSASIMSDIDIILSRYTSSDYARLQAHKELQKHIVGNSLIEDVIYTNGSSVLLTTRYIPGFDGGDISLLYNGNKRAFIPYRDLAGSRSVNVLLSIPYEGGSLLLYVPSQSHGSSATYFVINKEEFSRSIRLGNSASLTAVSLVSAADRQPVFSVGTQIRTELYEQIPDDWEGSFKANASEFVYYTHLPTPDLIFTAISNTAFLEDSLQQTLFPAYSLLLAISLVGVAFVVVSMGLTYLPLHKVSRQLSKADSHASGRKPFDEIAQIRSAFDHLYTTQEEQERKIRSYRTAVQKIVFESFTIESTENPLSIAQLDELFDDDNQYLFAVANVYTPVYSDDEAMMAAIRGTLKAGTLCVLLDRFRDYFALLLCCPSQLGQTEAQVTAVLRNLAKRESCSITLSEFSTSPAKIARMCDHAGYAARYLESGQLMSYQDLNPAPGPQHGAQSPYQHLDALAASLEQLDYEEAGQTLDLLFSAIDVRLHSDFFIRFILIDTITLLVEYVTKQGIKFERFSEVYYQILGLCRSGNYVRDREKIREDMRRVIRVMEEEIENSEINMRKILQYIDKHCLSPSFSLTVLADEFHISIAYMSILFKKKMGVTLTDYVWKLRLEESKRLLNSTDMSIDAISLEVGYYNPASFRRRFKETMNLSPSQYRKKNGSEHRD